MKQVLLWPFKVVAAILLIIIFFIPLWAFGVRIKITRKGEKIGYIRWFKFYPKETYDEYV